jgi:hypothetical protein
MAFEVFTKKAVGSVSEPFVSIQKKGIIAMNHAAFDALGQPKAVELLFDRERQRVGLRAVDPNVDHAYVVRPNAKGSSHLVSGTRFAKHYGIPVEVDQRWPAHMDKNVLVIDIGEPPVG